jgi:phage baseplate assembly protein W
MTMHEDFVGAGWAFPLRVDANGGIALVRRERELEEAMRLVLSTYPGERPMRPDWGCRLRDYVFAGVNGETVASLAMEVRTALMRWEPRVDIEAVDVVPDPDTAGLVYIDIQYKPKTTNDRRNLVFPFYSIPEDGSDY